ncbi:class I SAM-dependent RNA methyltransferase [Occallatibacter riparius]|uniref:DOT1 domain-containing protein n=1 Tax=Occallatibacter riparius TaxID=1002689 RepID=A0A9J7BS96_9BACT|nr:hypothetical protein [Occallatibacter riparius]UWZ85536.1 hypothetical protein MOP44_06240 [Occallatibacter riparius]
MSTISSGFAPVSSANSCAHLWRLFDGLGDLSHLLRPRQLAQRLAVLDELDLLFGGLTPEELGTCSDSRIMERVQDLMAELEAANAKLYAAVRSEIVLRGNALALRSLLTDSFVDNDHKWSRAGFGFDALDEIVNGVLQLHEPDGVGPQHSPEMIAYQPTPTRHILDLIAWSGLSGDDTLVDLGSGLGHVPLLASILTGSRALGIEVQLGYVASAQECAKFLNLEHVQFAAGDARQADISTGTVFYLFSPFNGSILSHVLNRLLTESKDRHIRICSLGPCTHILQNRTWLRAITSVHSERVTVFESL